MENIVEKLQRQIETGREVLGTQAKINIPFSPRAVLTEICHKDMFVFREELPYESKLEPRVWYINAENAELAHFVKNPNPAPCPDAVVNSEGTLILITKEDNWEEFLMIDLVPSSKVASVPGKVFCLAAVKNDPNVPKEWQRSNLYSYDVEEDKFHDCHEIVDGALLYKNVTTERAFGKRLDHYFIAKNRFSVIAVKDKDGTEHLYRKYTGTKFVKFGPEGQVIDQAIIDFGLTTDIIPIEGSFHALIVKVLPMMRLSDGTEVVDEDGTPQYIFVNPDTFHDFTVLDNGETLKAATMCKDVLTVVTDQNVKVFTGVPSNLETTTVTGDVAEVIAAHPYYVSERTIYDIDGQTSDLMTYTDGKDIVHVKYKKSDRGDLFSVV